MEHWYDALKDKSLCQCDVPYCNAEHRGEDCDHVRSDGPALDGLYLRIKELEGELAEVGSDRDYHKAEHARLKVEMEAARQMLNSVRVDRDALRLEANKHKEKVEIYENMKKKSRIMGVET